MPIKRHICKGGQAGNKIRQLLVFSELPSLPSAGSRPGCLHTSLGCEPRSLLRVSLGWFDYSKNVRKDNPTPDYSPVSDRRRLTALVEVHWARRVQAPMPQISGPNSQENHIIETCKEEGCAVLTQKIAARRKWEIEHLTRLSASWTDSRPHQRIVDQLTGGSQYYVRGQEPPGIAAQHSSAPVRRNKRIAGVLRGSPARPQSLSCKGDVLRKGSP
jgi:hypothetical protein